MAIIELKNIYKSYQMGTLEVQALKNVSFSIQKGEFVSISGPSGSGKSTILNLLGLIDFPNAGEIIVDGESILTESEQKNFVKTGSISGKTDSKICVIRKNHIGFIFQNFNLLPVLNIYENIDYPLHLGSDVAKSMSQAEKKEWVDYLIDRVGLKKWVDHKPTQLSGGQRQRVAIARALVTKAPIILADEPTANLDSKTGTQILDLMMEINKEFKTTFIFSTHDKKIVDLTNHVIKILDGQVVEDSNV